MSDEYRIVTTTFHGMSKTRKAIEVDKPNHQGTVWIPRTLIHGGDDLRKVEHARPRTEITFRLMEWKAEELGFA